MSDWINRLVHTLMPNRFTDGTSQSVRVTGDWPWPVWITIVLIILIFFLIYRSYKKTRGDLSWKQRHLLLALRCITSAIVFLMLAQWILVTEQLGMPILAIILDDSLSMRIKDVDRQPEQGVVKANSGDPFDRERWNQAVDVLCGGPSPLLDELAQDYRLKVYLLDGKTELKGPVTDIASTLRVMKPERATTPLGKTIHEVIDQLRGQPPVGVIVLTDGVVNEGPGLEDAAKRASQELVPLYFVGFGAEKGSPDLSVQSWVMEDTVFLGDHVSLQAQLVAKNTAAKEARVRLTDITHQQILEEERVPISAETTVFTMIFKAEQAGEIELRLECLPIQDEIDLRNNALSRRILVKKDTIRILMVEEVPRFEYRFLRNALIREPGFDLTTVLLGADPEYVEEMKGAMLAVPTSRDELWSYDVIILGDVAPNRLSPSTLEAVAAFVEEKDPPGGLILVGGPHAMPHEYNQSVLDKVLPCAVGVSPANIGQPKTAAHRLAVTREGLVMPWLAFGRSPTETERVWHSLPPVYWLQSVIELKPGARVLVESREENQQEGRGEPVVIFQYVGAGKVLFHATDETWRWRRGAGLAAYRHYWIEAVRFMARGKLESARTPRLVTDRSEYQAGDSVHLMLECPKQAELPLRNGSVAIWLEYEGRTRREVTLQRHPLRGDLFEATLQNLAPGQYYAWVPITSGIVPATGFAVVPPLQEWEATQMARKEMETAARLSGGGFYLPNEVRRLRDDLPHGRGTLIEMLPPRPLWNSPIVLLLLVLTLSLEWLLRKRYGLL